MSGRFAQFAIALALLALMQAFYSDAAPAGTVSSILDATTRAGISAAMRSHRCSSPRLSPDDRIQACNSLVGSGTPGINSIPFLVNLGRAYAQKGDFADALHALNLAASYISNNYIDRIHYGDSYAAVFEERSVVYAEMGDSDNAMKELARLSPFVDNSGQLLAQRCWVRAIEGKYLQAALGDCNQALSTDQGSADDLDSRGLVQFKLANWQAAIADFDAAIERNHNLISSYYMRGLTKRHLGDTSGADADISTAEEAEPYIAQEFVGYGILQ